MVKNACVEEASEVPSSSSQSPDDSEASCVDTNRFLIVSYNRGTLGQTGTGHFSPIAAYDEASDQVLILDVARFKYGPHWVPLPLLFDAMLPCDPDTNQSRGYVLLSYQKKPDCCQHPLPQSILFRSEMSQYPVRQQYQRFLSTRNTTRNSSSITLEEVLKFWSQNGNDLDRVWDMIAPQLLPIDLNGKKCVDGLLSLIHSLTNTPDQHVKSKHCHEPQNCDLVGISCRQSFNRMVRARPLDAIYVIYLASLSSKERRQAVQRSLDEAGIRDYSCAALKQLFAEAELVRLAIDYSHANADGPENTVQNGDCDKCKK
mmetsp:Transcript_1836/g.2786  ORF Transcript_1836/g.2786 Transcript_1836/m.2786 type:complete len:316 (-) Transcript_1836:380-1327(-)|eukprot:CAMPEP_0195507250 /NCGR_PEP_ID=MMETSP0794_2-20130614/737_1 /TAXON_ID=515487 /ORGANISM="Stephanopyxis turris, Strain CCMP 815" /LENGTH=315 /DNA_ID=CAMNT_0040633869 /DNA_START=544 /DNA_END=1491 /DNA_ORIENTATION=+